MESCKCPSCKGIRHLRRTVRLVRDQEVAGSNPVTPIAVTLETESTSGFTCQRLTVRLNAEFCGLIHKSEDSPMPRARQQIPTYLNRRGRGAVVVYRGGVRTEITLPGKFGSKESKEEYQALLARLRIADGELPKDPFSKGGLTIRTEEHTS